MRHECILEGSAILFLFGCVLLQPELLEEVLEMLRSSAALHGGASGGAGSSIALQVEQICRVMRQWGQTNGLL